MGKLEDLRVERVDGVDRPATGHQWAIIKSEGATASQLIDELEKSGELSDEQRELLATLKASVVKADEPEGDEPEGDEPDDEDDPEGDEPEGDEPEDDERDADDPGRALKAAVTELLRSDEGKAIVKGVLDEIVAEELADAGDTDDVPVAKSEAAPLRSKQPVEQDVEKGDKPVAKSKGNGMFTNIIFGQGR